MVLLEAELEALLYVELVLPELELVLHEVELVLPELELVLPEVELVLSELELVLPEVELVFLGRSFSVVECLLDEHSD